MKTRIPMRLPSAVQSSASWLPVAGHPVLIWLGLGLAALYCAGCGPLLSVGGPETDLYNLTPERNYAEDLPEVDWQLVVEEPLAAGGFDNNRIAVRPAPTELKYFSGARWTERAPRMVQNLIVQSFEDSGKIVGVGRQVIGLRSDFNLKTELRDFQAEVFREEDAPRIRVRLNAKLVRQPRQEIVASKNFEQIVPCQGRGMREVVAGFDLALGRVIRDLVEWTLRTPAAVELNQPRSSVPPDPAPSPPAGD